MHRRVVLTAAALLPLAVCNREKGFRLLEEACHEGERNTQPLIGLGYTIYPGVRGKPTR